jgi:hypothetical protein
MRWLSSNGGPLICGEEYLSGAWKGVDGSSANFGFKNDYERACSTREYLEKIACAGGCVLVLGDEPLQSTFFRIETNEESLAIARWIYATSPEGAERFLAEAVVDVRPSAEVVPFNVVEGELVLFDSAMSWPAEPCLRAYLEPDSYLVTTEMHKLEGKFSFIVHRFLRN